MKFPKILLASQSPRRFELLTQAGFDVEVVHNSVDESFSDQLPVLEVAEFLANKKAKESIHLWVPDTILLTADSVVIINDEILNKPQDRQDAIGMLNSLSDKTHTVCTGVSLFDGLTFTNFTGISQVTFHPISLSEIEYYVDNYKPYDKAGGYGVQEWLGLVKVKSIVGTYANVMGLPVDLVYKNLLNLTQQT